MLKKLLIILLLFFPVHSAGAELPYITLHDYKIAKNTKEFQSWISGWMAGAGWINLWSKFYNGQFVFCLDPYIVKSGDFLSETLEKYFQKRLFSLGFFKTRIFSVGFLK